MISDLTVLGAPGTEAFHLALGDQSDALFVLVVGRTAATVLPCPPGQERSARNFVTAVLETSRRAEADNAEREVRVRLAEREVEAVATDRWRTKAAEEAYGKVEGDLSLITPIEEARRRLAAAHADNAELLQARKNLDALTRTFAAPPEPLRTTAPDP